ncbi:MAG: hypothetical protein ACI8WB_000043 [Phenylobacterium sp.]|jgi:hypothetical protein
MQASLLKVKSKSRSRTKRPLGQRSTSSEAILQPKNHHIVPDVDKNYASPRKAVKLAANGQPTDNSI